MTLKLHSNVVNNFTTSDNITVSAINNSVKTSRQTLLANEKSFTVINDSSVDLPKSNINLLFDDISLKDDDMKRLDPGVYLNDNIINSYVYMCNSSQNDAFFFDTFIFRYWQNNEYVKAIDYLAKKSIDLKAFKYLVIPINIVVQNHWSAILINFVDNTITHLDSLNKYDRNKSDPIIKLVKVGLSKLNVDSLLDQNALKQILIDCPVQENMYDCGVFTCLFIRFIANGLLSFTFNQNDITEFRTHMKNEINGKKLLDFDKISLSSNFNIDH